MGGGSSKKKYAKTTPAPIEDGDTKSQGTGATISRADASSPVNAEEETLAPSAPVRVAAAGRGLASSGASVGLGGALPADATAALAAAKAIREARAEAGAAKHPVTGTNAAAASAGKVASFGAERGRVAAQPRTLSLYGPGEGPRGAAETPLTGSSLPLQAQGATGLALPTSNGTGLAAVSAEIRQKRPERSRFKHVDVGLGPRKVLFYWVKHARKRVQVKREYDKAAALEREKMAAKRRRRKKGKARVDRVVSLYLENQEELERLCLREPGMLLQTQLELLDRRIEVLSSDVAELGAAARPAPGSKAAAEVDERKRKLIERRKKKMRKTLQVGSHVSIHGLKSAAHLNGKEGVCDRFDEESGRWFVRLSGGEMKALKPENLTVEEEDEKEPSIFPEQQLSWEGNFDRAIARRQEWKQGRAQVQLEAEEATRGRWLAARMNEPGKGAIVLKVDFLAQLKVERERILKLVATYEAKIRKRLEQDVVDFGEALHEERMEAEKTLAEAIREQRQREEDDRVRQEAAERRRREEEERKLQEQLKRLEEQRLESERLRRERQEAERQRREEEQRLRQEQEAQRRRELEAEMRRIEEEQRRRREAELQERLRLEQEERKRREEEDEEERRRQEEEIARLKLEEAEKLRLEEEQEGRRKAEEERRRAEEDQRRHQLEEEERRRQIEEEERQRREEEEQKRIEEEHRLLREEREAERRRLEEEERRAAEEAEAERLKFELELRRKLEEEQEKRVAETEQKKKAARKRAWVNDAFEGLMGACESDGEDGEADHDTKAPGEATTEPNAEAPPGEGGDWLSKALAALGDEDESSGGESGAEEGATDEVLVDNADVDLLRLTEVIADRIGAVHGPGSQQL